MRVRLALAAILLLALPSPAYADPSAEPPPASPPANSTTAAEDPTGEPSDEPTDDQDDDDEPTEKPSTHPTATPTAVPHTRDTEPAYVSSVPPPRPTITTTRATPKRSSTRTPTRAPTRQPAPVAPTTVVPGPTLRPTPAVTPRATQHFGGILPKPTSVTMVLGYIMVAILGAAILLVLAWMLLVYTRERREHDG